MRINERTDDSIRMILLRTFRLGCQQRGNGLTSQIPTDLARTGCADFSKNRGLFLSKPAGIEVDWSVVPFKPFFACKGLLRSRESG